MTKHFVVMGVSGSGKSTVGASLAQRLDLPFADADDFHSPAAVAKMSAGHALTDDDRWPWLDAVGTWLADHPQGGVTACSALKRLYRDRLRAHCPDVLFVHLDGSGEVIARRQGSRRAHFMPSSLLRSQFDALEPLDPDERGVLVDVDAGVDDLVTSLADRFGA